MSRADADPNPSPNTSSHPASSRSTSDSPSVDPSLLDEVLQNTLSLSSVTPRELSDLIDIGRRYCGQPLVEDPIGVELVEVILRHRLAAVTSDGTRRREMARQIAESLLEDPQCEPRLRAFWGQLAEATR